MLILAIDTALAACSAGLYQMPSEKVLAERMEPMARGHAERLTPMVEEIMREAGRSLEEVGRIAVSVGPGTFTGVRIGIAFARGLSLALGCPAVGVSTLEALAAGARDKAGDLPIVALIDARRGAVYAQVFAPQNLRPVTRPAAIALSDIAACLPDDRMYAVGSGAEMAAQSLASLVTNVGAGLPMPAAIAQRAAVQAAPATPPSPLYLRQPDAKEQARTLRLSPADTEIIPADAAHCEVLAKMHAECQTEPWTSQDFAQLLAMPGTSAYLACSANGQQQPVAFILVRQAADEAEILMLATRPAARRRKAATGLLSHTAAALRQQGIATLHLDVDETNVSARAFYVSAGFAECGRRKGYYGHPDGTRTDAILMHKPL